MNQVKRGKKPEVAPSAKAKPCNLTLDDVSKGALKDFGGGEVSAGARRAAMLIQSVAHVNEEVFCSMATIGQQIRRMREEGFREDREAFALRAGCSPEVVDAIEQGDVAIPSGLLLLMLSMMHTLHGVVDAINPSSMILACGPVSWPTDE